MLIRNYGLFWQRSEIHWGAQGKANNPGHLKGVPAKNLTADPVDFVGQQGIYALYDQTFTLVYIGQTGAGNQRLLTRLRNHRSDHLADRWARFSWFGVRRVNQNGQLAAENAAAHPAIRDVLNHLEAILIAVAEPKNNLHSGPFGNGVQQYRQYRDVKSLGPREYKKMLREICEKMNRERD
jgi:hypothetical protein